ncbi:MAG: DEAD/DEAH box helicase family protein [Actinomyces urogenitalis]|uniref:DEAD/DEAH box helicase family protein n=1 Tax=Actinomyces urogenitalis TaxID=103621 RepID=UPI00280557A5|nr:DEAD/DEAH box helicase family protein [Actinomyces urogenitalis]MDU6151367.1 DEAD/DEAH box helicase family protein [Actinomyces urogenitalis]
MTDATRRPAHNLRMAARLRAYQRDLLDAVDPADGEVLHLVAPPGAGKTLLGLELARRNGRPALVLTPTTIIREQWREQAASLFEGEWGDNLCVSTYQSLALVRSDGVWDEAGLAAWKRELVDGGYSPAQAEAWLEDLASSHRQAYRRGVSRRAARARARVDELDDKAVANLLAPSARQRLDALVEAGVATIVLDECHHLRAHWAVVVHYLVRRLRHAGHQATLIGLTATSPSPEDRSYSRYHALLGEVDAQISVPAVVRAGHLAPDRALAWFTLPEREEARFLATSGAELAHRVAQVLLAPDGVDYLVDTVAPGLRELMEDPGCTLEPEDPRLATAVAEGFDAAPQAAATATALLHRTRDYRPTPASTLLVPLLPQLSVLETSELTGLLARYALERLLPDPARRSQWEEVRQTLSGFGVHLTDSGLRPGRSPVDLITSSSLAKDTAVIDVLRHELDALGSRLRAVVVTDAAERSAAHRALDVLTGDGRPAAPGGALRCFETLLSDEALRGLGPVLITSRHLRLASGQEELLATLRERTGLELSGQDDGVSLTVAGPGVGSAALVLAVSELMAAGRVRLVVSTRALLGEGWDCPAANTLVDLSTVTTATAVAQLRGRGARLDPSWPGKVAHYWSVVCVLPAQAGLGGGGDLGRLERKADQIWSAVPSEATPWPGGDCVPSAGGTQAVIETGLRGVLSPPQRLLLASLTAGAQHAQVACLNELTVASLGDRGIERERWLGAATGIDPDAMAPQGGSGRSARAERSGYPVEVVRIQWASALLRHGVPSSYWQAAACVVARCLSQDGGAHAHLAVLEETDNSLSVGLVDGSDGAGARFADALAALLSEPERRPRFVLEAQLLTTTANPRRPLPAWRRALARLLLQIGRLPGRSGGDGDWIALAVPSLLVRSRQEAEALVAGWTRWVGPCRLRLVRDGDDAAAYLAARGAHGPVRYLRVERGRRWVEQTVEQAQDS